MSAVTALKHLESGAGLRHAVLRWYGLCASDRNWLLDQLDPPGRQRVIALWRELDELDLAPRRAHAAPKPVCPDRLPPRPDVAVLCAVLAAEPPLLIARLLAARAWPWRQDLLARLDPAQRTAVAGCVLPLTSMPVALALALEKALAGRYARTLAARRSRQQASPRQSWWSVSGWMERLSAALRERP